ncbi:DUF1540 domain-containing protein [Clostridium malenominatum]|uniref:DUF1540 domain-containing protein n=1 Tax=Clostridium malenominatum TaxID=1539 RepID=A0ABN1IMH5_9CLOT
MERISCDVLNCSHNKEAACYANVINVGGLKAKNSSHTSCGSFLDSAHYGTLTNNANNPGSPCSAITCNVQNCIYNSDKLCNAESIKVTGDDVQVYTQANCSTFEPKQY